ncbi:MAG: hypothetical protein L3J39_07520 [Verrucomicrobiales bacterium]|nr:hypothetical protein [Verrucomicrobiales bacterium]
MNEAPIGIALILCDSIITDAKTGKNSLIGLFNNINCNSLPSLHARFCIFAQLTNGRGKQSIDIRCQSLQAEEVVFQTGGEIEFVNPNQVIEIQFELLNLTFPHAGMYTVELEADGMLVIESRFNVTTPQL